jgi:hypothetical protein
MYSLNYWPLGPRGVVIWQDLDQTRPRSLRMIAGLCMLWLVKAQFGPLAVYAVDSRTFWLYKKKDQQNEKGRASYL